MVAMWLGAAVGLASFSVLAWDSWLHRNPGYSCAVASHDKAYWDEHDVDTESLEIDGSWRLLPTGLTCTYRTNEGRLVDVPQNPGLTFAFAGAVGGAVLAVVGAVGMGPRRRTGI